METANSPNPLQQYCLTRLQQILDLAMKAAEMASAEGNQKLTLQAVREITRIIALMTRITGSPGKKKTQETTKSPVPAPRGPVVDNLSDGLIQEMLNSFPVLNSNQKPANSGLANKNCLPHEREKGGKLPGRVAP